MEIKTLQEVMDNPHLLEVARLAIEDHLVAMRDSRISIPGVNNGLVIREKDGEKSHIIRMTHEQAMRVGIQAIIEYLEKNEQ